MSAEGLDRVWGALGTQTRKISPPERLGDGGRQAEWLRCESHCQSSVSEGGRRLNLKRSTGGSGLIRRRQGKSNGIVKSSKHLN